MKNINANMSSMAMQLKNMAAQSALKPVDTNTKVPNDSPQNFVELLKQAVDNVSETQKKAGKLKKAFELGDPNIDLTQVMVASEKSSIAFKAMLEVRKNLMKSYQDIMSMHV